MQKYRHNDHVILTAQHLNKELHGSVFTIDKYLGNDEYTVKESDLFIFRGTELDPIKELNTESLSWGEWIDAAGVDLVNSNSTAISIYYKAWKMGEDPTEYRK